MKHSTLPMYLIDESTYIDTSNERKSNETIPINATSIKSIWSVSTFQWRRIGCVSSNWLWNFPNKIVFFMSATADCISERANSSMRSKNCASATAKNMPIDSVWIFWCRTTVKLWAIRRSGPALNVSRNSKVSTYCRIIWWLNMTMIRPMVMEARRWKRNDGKSVPNYRREKLVVQQQWRRVAIAVKSSLNSSASSGIPNMRTVPILPIRKAGLPLAPIMKTAVRASSVSCVVDISHRLNDSTNTDWFTVQRLRTQPHWNVHFVRDDC